ncbi:Putative negative regulator of RcsB-dependent stress response [Persephonella hydrogeniphila]|uniref:Putative negative regulator of RcsB-dependent stress response n=1 Tax=Persephonella hydrogeniphila TaxID=198703 RepID=A0A285NPG7_9AQUI|nr:tetratricopeptide repeat protein [Persephonella hydrogeniphila]SNZ11420.1 Putative negative regulator of RcsB-dependent stress response [Persephonella hydrogeniphila]
MEKKKVPLEKDVDIEFEYKVYMIYDFLKKNKIFVITGVVLVFLLIFTFFAYKHHKETVLNESSAIVYQIQKAYDSKDYKKVQELVNKLKKEYSGSPFVKLGIAYQLLVKKEKEEIKPEDLNKLQVRVNSDQINAGLTEYRAYLYYRNKQYGKVITTVRPIDQRFYNYVSALMLKGFALKKLGEEDKAVAAFNQVLQLSRYDYFKLIAKENL